MELKNGSPRLNNTRLLLWMGDLMVILWYLPKTPFYSKNHSSDIFSVASSVGYSNGRSWLTYTRAQSSAAKIYQRSFAFTDPLT